LKLRRGRAAVSRLALRREIEFAKLKIRYLADAGQMKGLSVVHVRLPPRYQHASLCHRRTHEWLMILKGSGRGVIDGRTVRFRPGVILYMPPGVMHQMGTGSSALEAVVIFTPPLDIEGPAPDICFPDGARA
jgi:mannose-6-phosphate isomerase-like protein (cupin superfamily)